MYLYANENTQAKQRRKYFINVMIIKSILQERFAKPAFRNLSHVMRKPVLPYANNKGADLISAFVVRCLDSIISIFAIIYIS